MKEAAFLSLCSTKEDVLPIAIAAKSSKKESCIFLLRLTFFFGRRFD